MKTSVDRFSSTNTIGWQNLLLCSRSFQQIALGLKAHAGAASGVFAARYAGFIKGTTAGTITWNAGSSYRCCYMHLIPASNLYVCIQNHYFV
jgi:hypothetical protein